ncbi:hypothetical protein [Paenibacillus sp. Y412MC10]|uniref:hypothetical protein n=1 Tax=Geobacillus sp. (strain Y412MC10) TaxID=481743 RepID=UPI0011A0E182|nr:hypothetical protein [Paenibacillus sp. Y412MC10]
MSFIPDYDKLKQLEKRRIDWQDSVEIASKRSPYNKAKGTVIAIIPASNGFPVLYEVRFPDGKTDTFNRKQLNKIVTTQ